MNQLNKLKYFQQEAKKPFVNSLSDLLCFMIEVKILAFCYILIEKGQDFKDKNASEFLNFYFQEGLYFVFTTITTVGYGDKSPSTSSGMAFVMFGLFLYGATRIITVIGGFNHSKSEVRNMKDNGRLFEPKNDHVIVYCDARSIATNNFKWIERFVKEIKTSNRFRGKEILFVNHNEEISPRFNAYMTEHYFEQDRVSHYNTNIDEIGFFDKISIANADHVFIIANPDDTHSDSNALDFAIRIEEETPYDKHVTAEVVNDENRKRMVERAGVDVVIRPTRSYPCFLVSATIGKDGVREVIEELMSRGKDTLEVFDARKASFQWGELLYKGSMAGIGTVIAYVDENGNVDPNPMGYDEIKDCHRVIFMIQNMGDKCYDVIQSEVDKILDEVKH
jgi:hypothetical protein